MLLACGFLALVIASVNVQARPAPVNELDLPVPPLPHYLPSPNWSDPPEIPPTEVGAPDSDILRTVEGDVDILASALSNSVDLIGGSYRFRHSCFGVLRVFRRVQTVSIVPRNIPRSCAPLLTLFP